MCHSEHGIFGEEERPASVSLLLFEKTKAL